MYFGEQPVAKTAQAIAAHSIKLKHRTLKKGTVITDRDVADLIDAGFESIVVARLEAEDIGEDQAALALASAIANDSLQPDKPFTGRCNIRAGVQGLLHVNATGVEHINRVHESLTIATLADLTLIRPGEMAATVKVIPFAVDTAILESCLEAARRNLPILQVLPFTGKRVGFIQTTSTGTRKQVLEKTTAVLEQRLTPLQCQITGELRCRHDNAELEQAVRTMLNTDIDILLIIGASVIVDRRDVIPAAIEATGSEIIHFGMPTDPGNLLLMARHGTRPVLGLPGCARSPKRNGLDLILERLAADIPVTAADVMALGHGGLLQEIKSRPQPREKK